MLLFDIEVGSVYMSGCQFAQEASGWGFNVLRMVFGRVDYC